PCPKKRHDGLFEFVLSQPLCRGDSDARGKLLQLIEIPITVLEVAQRHCGREGVRHAARAYPLESTSDVGEQHVVDSLNRLVRIGAATAASLDRVQPRV